MSHPRLHSLVTRWAMPVFIVGVLLALGVAGFAVYRTGLLDQKIVRIETIHQGPPGPIGPSGVPGKDSTIPGPPGPSGVPGRNGTNGINGKNGTTTTIVVCELPTGVKCP